MQKIYVLRKVGLRFSNLGGRVLVWIIHSFGHKTERTRGDGKNLTKFLNILNEQRQI